MTTFLAPDGPLGATALDAAVDDGEIRLLLDVDGPEWDRVRTARLFHLGGLSLPPGLQQDVACRVVLRLDDRQAELLLDEAGGPDAARAALLGELPEAVRDESRWHLEDVRRDLEVPPELDGPGVRLVEGASAVEVPVTGDGSLLSFVQSWLVDQGMTATRLEGLDVLRLDGAGANGSWVLLLETREAEGLVLVFSSWPEQVPDERLDAVMQLVTRINPDLPVGAYELDLDRGQLSLRTSVDVSASSLDAGLLARLVEANLTAFDDYLPVLLDVLDGHAPQTALARHGH